MVFNVFLSTYSLFSIYTGRDPQLLDQQLGRLDQGLGADQVLQRGQQDQSLEAGQDQARDPPSKHGVDLNLGPQHQIHDHP